MPPENNSGMRNPVQNSMTMPPRHRTAVTTLLIALAVLFVGAMAFWLYTTRVANEAEAPSGMMESE